MASVNLADISKSFDTTSVIERLNLDIPDGSFTVFVGPSGCGKSTLLRMVAGLEEVSGGTISIGGRKANELTPVERGIAMVFQNYALYPHMTVEKNIGFSLRMAGMKADERRRRVLDAARTLQIEPLLQRRPAQLSGGQRQRVAIGRAIVRDPEVFLFDEPLSNLDAELRVSMRVEIAKLHQRIRSTMIYVTHDQVEAMTLADQIVVMRAGRIEQVGSPEELYDDPQNVFVAGFIGSPRMNFLEGQATANGVRLKAAPQLTLPAAAGEAGGALQVGVRPDYLSLDNADNATLSGRVDLTENIGGTRFVYATLNSGEQVVAKTDRPTRLQPGENVHFRVDPARCLYFDAQGKRVRAR